MEDYKETVYSIGEAADLLGVSVPTLRLYEREGLILPLRKKSGHRLFVKQDLERIRCLRESINGKKMSIAGIRRLLSLVPCWRIKSCPNELRNQCRAYTNSDAPCWSIPEREWECRTANCRECEVYVDLSDCSSLKSTIARLTSLPEPS
jgi:MerR family transcriptional regulator, heat shock protein HspR